jgi:hypothetical protein
MPRLPSSLACSVELTVSYLYQAMSSYFDRDNVGLPGFAKFFKVRIRHADMWLQTHAPSHTQQAADVCGVCLIWLQAASDEERDHAEMLMAFQVCMKQTYCSGAECGHWLQHACSLFICSQNMCRTSVVAACS